MKTGAPICPCHPEIIHIGCQIEEAFSSQVEAFAGALAEGKPESFSQWIDTGKSLSRSKLRVTVATFRPKSVVSGNCFEQCRLSRTIFSNKEKHPRSYFNLVDCANGRDSKWI